MKKIFGMNLYSKVNLINYKDIKELISGNKEGKQNSIFIHLIDDTRPFKNNFNKFRE